MKIYPIRFRPGCDIKIELDNLVKNNGWSAACIIMGIGSVAKIALRYANQDTIINLNGKFEIVSLCGTLSKNGSHIHIIVSDEKGDTCGGHLKEGTIIYTTAEIVIGILDEWEFSRELDPDTGSKELKIVSRVKYTIDNLRDNNEF